MKLAAILKQVFPKIGSTDDPSESIGIKSVDIDKYLEQLIASGKLNGKTQALIDGINDLNEQNFLSESQIRFAKALILSRIVQDQGASMDNDEVERAMDALPEPIRPAVLASFLLAPEELYSKVSAASDDDVGTISALFSIPISAAHLRRQFDKEIALG